MTGAGTKQQQDMAHRKTHCTAYIGLGANLGDTAHALHTALDTIARLPHTHIQAVSSFYRSSPVDSSGPDYLNAVARVDTGLSPDDLLTRLQGIEVQQGRVRPAGAHNAPRTLDLDVLLYGDVSMNTSRLTLPHPRMHQRAFVLMPLLEVAGQGISAGQRSRWQRCCDHALTQGQQTCVRLLP